MQKPQAGRHSPPCHWRGSRNWGVAARDLATKKIRVAAIAPGLFDTPILPEPARESLAATIPHPARLGQPEECAMLAEQIVANPTLNGGTIRLDGVLGMAPR
jgi:NAD(P)-dependent dehydrogenase (short-subunit alcohol dehydrogenase family)